MANIPLSDLRLMQGLAQKITARNPALLNGDSTVGELAWVWGQTYDALNEFWNHRLWFVDDELAAYGWAVLPYRVPRGDGTFRESKEANLRWQVDPDHPELLNDVMTWYDDVAGDVDRLLIIQTADDAAQAFVPGHGYVHDPDDGDWIKFSSRDLTDVAEPVLPDGFQFLTADEVSVAEIVKAHQAAWHPSSFTETAMERVQKTWPYRSDMHVFVQAPDGTLAGSAIVWLDEAMLTAEFEPVSTHPDYRRRGLGSALQLHGMQKARAAGAKLMLVACLGAPEHPSAQNMYHGVGFREITRDMTYMKVAP